MEVKTRTVVELKRSVAANTAEGRNGGTWEHVQGIGSVGGHSLSWT